MTTARGTFSPQRQCTGKVQWATKKKAKVAARRNETANGGGRVESYRCPHCGCWHNGHRPPEHVVSPGVES